MYGDGGQSGFNVGNSALRFNTFTSNFHDVNFQNGDPSEVGHREWADRGQRRECAVLLAHHCRSCQSQGRFSKASLSVWRTQDWAGDQTFLEAELP